MLFCISWNLFPFIRLLSVIKQCTFSPPCSFHSLSARACWKHQYSIHCLSETWTKACILPCLLPSLTSWTMRIVVCIACVTSTCALGDILHCWESYRKSRGQLALQHHFRACRVSRTCIKNHDIVASDSVHLVVDECHSANAMED